MDCVKNAAALASLRYRFQECSCLSALHVYLPSLLRGAYQNIDNLRPSIQILDENGRVPYKFCATMRNQYVPNGMSTSVKDKEADVSLATNSRSFLYDALASTVVAVIFAANSSHLKDNLRPAEPVESEPKSTRVEHGPMRLGPTIIELTLGTVEAVNLTPRGII